MKKTFIVVALLIACSLALFGCSEADVEEENAGTETTEATEEKIEGLSQGSSDLDIIEYEGHPKYFDSFQTAMDAWGIYKDGRMLIDSTAWDHDVKQIAEIRKNYSTEMISMIDLYLDDVDDNPYDTVDEALELAREYTELDTLNEYYDLEMSYGFKFSDETNYVIAYYRNDNENDSLHKYFYVIIDTDPEGTVTGLCLTDTITPAIAETMVYDDFYKNYGDRELLDWDAAL